MRIIIALTLLTTPAAAWEFSSTPICTLSHDSTEGSAIVTYDASLPAYTITITLTQGGWPPAAIFGMIFEGNNPITIQTDQQQLSPDGLSLTVKDRGFGNVLNGLEFNQTAYAILGDTRVAIPLDGIGPAMQAFRNCPADTLS